MQSGVVTTVALDRLIFASSGINQNIFDLLIKLVTVHRAKFHEDADILPTFQKFFAGVTVERAKAIAYFLSNKVLNLTNLGITLQKAARHIQGNISTVDRSTQRHQKLGDHIIAIVADKNVIAEQLDLSAIGIDIRLHFREV